MGFENGQLLRVVMRALGNDGDQQVSTFHYDLDNNSDAQTNNPQSLADRFRDDVMPLWVTSYSVGWTIQPVIVQDEKDPLNPLAPRQEWASGVATPGSYVPGGDLLPRFCTPVVALLTANIGRRFRGRTWLGGVYTESDQNAGVWGTLTAFNTRMAAIPMEPDIAGPGSTATAKWCVYSRTQRAANLNPYASAVSGYIVRPQVHSLRSRATY